jgi:glutathione S-transferase
MTLKLYMHPLSSYCHKVLIAFYENDTPFEVKQLDDAAVAGEFKAMWPMARFPLLRDEKRDHIIPESSIIIDYLALHYPGKVKLVPDDPDRARQVRMRDRFFDNYMHTPMQKFSADRLRPENKRDPLGVDEARAMYRTALDMVESEMADKTWAMGNEFTMADCAAAPALFYGDKFFGPFRETHKNAMAYLDRLMARPSYARALEEAKPYMHLVPK